MPSSTSPVPLGIDTSRVGRWLRETVPDACPPFSYELIVGGGSNLTYRVVDGEDHRWALRRPPVGRTLATAHDMAREVRIIRALADSAVPVPSCLGYCVDPEVTGARFYVMNFVEGRVLRDRESTRGMTDADADTATDSLIDNQIRMHTLDLEAIGLGDLSRHGDYLGRQLARWHRQVTHRPVREVPLLVGLHTWLTVHKPEEQVRPGLAHGDYRFDNTVLDQQFGIAAVLDWELCTIGDPIADLAWSLEYWSDEGDPLSFLPDPPTASDAFVGRAEVARRYRSRCGFEIGDLSYYRVFSWWKQACIVEGVLARQLEAQRQGLPSTSDPATTARRVDALLDHAAELASLGPSIP
jgi:aminoglycoside phosphotransferase (APT) family kinase protein